MKLKESLLILVLLSAFAVNAFSGWSPSETSIDQPVMASQSN